MADFVRVWQVILGGVGVVLVLGLIHQINEIRNGCDH